MSIYIYICWHAGGVCTHAGYVVSWSCGDSDKASPTKRLATCLRSSRPIFQTWKRNLKLDNCSVLCMFGRSSRGLKNPDDHEGTGDLEVERYRKRIKLYRYIKHHSNELPNRTLKSNSAIHFAISEVYHPYHISYILSHFLCYLIETSTKNT